MKLRNKKTGAVADVQGLAIHNISFDLYDKNNKKLITDVLTLPTYYSSLAELNAEWEDYTPQEPLIKNEKIRKAVKAWAEANDYGKDEEYKFEDFSTGWKSWSLEHNHNGDDNEIHFNGGINFSKMNHQGYYTIAELCGEEES